MLLEIALLMGTDVEWVTGAAPAYPPESAAPASAAPTGGPVLEAGAANDDADMSDETPLIAAAAAAAPSESGRGRRSASAAAVTDKNSSAPASGNADAADADNAAAAGPTAGPGPAAAPAEADAIVLDVKDFTTWTPKTFALVPFDQIEFLTDPNMGICSVRSYLAVAMILWYDKEILAAHSRVWNGLQLAWHTTFHSDLSPVGMKKWPTAGPHAFNEPEYSWLAETLRYLKKPALRKRVPAGVPPPAPPKPAPAHTSRSSKPSKAVVHGSKRSRSTDPVRKDHRLVILLV
jgi:hypothetical protein